MVGVALEDLLQIDGQEPRAAITYKDVDDPMT